MSEATNGSAVDVRQTERVARRDEQIARRIEQFKRKCGEYGEEALNFAYHAALPVALNPEFLHLLRINFFVDIDDPLPYEVEFEFLLSSLCRQIDEGLYEVEREVRLVLLEGLAREFGQERMREVAMLLWRLIELNDHDLSQLGLQQAQQLTILNFCDQAKAQDWLQQATSETQNIFLETSKDWFVAMQAEILSTVKLKEKVGGIIKVDILKLNQRANTYLLQENYDEAKKIYMRLQKIFEVQLGVEHLDVATNLKNLAEIHTKQKRYEEAELLYQKTLDIQKRLLGEEHPDVVMNLNSLAEIYIEQKRYEEAELLYQKTLDIQKRLLGEEHPDVVTSRKNLDRLYQSQVIRMALPNQANNEINSALLEALQQLTGEELRELLKALKRKNNDSLTQLNFVHSKNFQVSVEGGKAYITEPINFNIDAAALQHQLEESLSSNKQFSTPYFYPTDLGSSYFVGRSKELEQLQKLLQSSEHAAIAAVSGIGGIGKTELAWQYVRQCQLNNTYPAGIWWLSGHGADLSFQILNHSLRLGLGQPPDALAQEVDKVQWCFDRWEQGLEGSRLLVIDDVMNYRTIRAFLPLDEKFKVLLTTRRKLGPPVQRLDLSVVSEAEALDLLQQLMADADRLAAEPEEAKKICEWLDYLPLGIELVGRYLARKPDLSLRNMMERLAYQGLDTLALRKVPEEMPYQLNLRQALDSSGAEIDEEVAN